MRESESEWVSEWLNARLMLLKCVYWKCRFSIDWTVSDVSVMLSAGKSENRVTCVICTHGTLATQVTDKVTDSVDSSPPRLEVWVHNEQSTGHPERLLTEHRLQKSQTTRLLRTVRRQALCTTHAPIVHRHSGHVWTEVVWECECFTVCTVLSQWGMLGDDGRVVVWLQNPPAGSGVRTHAGIHPRGS